MHVLDLCTGSGCIIISLLKQCQEVTGVGSDISKQALLVAKENAKTHDVDVEWIRSDLFQNINGSYDIIVSNPPYIPTKDLDNLMPEVRDFEPLNALEGFEDGLFFYDKIIKEGQSFLKPGGHLLFEIGYDQGESVTGMMKRAGYEKVRIIRDLSGLNRIVCGRKE
jgi:release factor glutamine methyltransferase